MGKYNKIAVIYGSDSSEWEVACRSGEFVASRIDGNQYDVYEIFARFGKWQLVAMKKKDAMRVPFPEGARPEIDKTDFSVKVYGEKVKFDFAYIMQHGVPGENGLMQGYFEMIGVPFSTCSAFVSAVAFDKFVCKSYLRDVDFVKCAPDVFVRNGMDPEDVAGKVAAKLSFPVFVKPTNAGSSFGISKVAKAEDIPVAINFAFSEGPMAIIEQGISGREMTCAGGSYYLPYRKQDVRHLRGTFTEYRTCRGSHRGCPFLPSFRNRFHRPRPSAFQDHPDAEFQSGRWQYHHPAACQNPLSPKGDRAQGARNLSYEDGLDEA